MYAVHSGHQLRRRRRAAWPRACAAKAELRINPIVYAEVSLGFARIEELDDALPADAVTRPLLPWEAGFLAGKAFVW